jgi:hypothetical protein
MIGTKVAELAVAGVLGVRFAGWDAVAKGTHCKREASRQQSAGAAQYVNVGAAASIFIFEYRNVRLTSGKFRLVLQHSDDLAG